MNLTDKVSDVSIGTLIALLKSPTGAEVASIFDNLMREAMDILRKEWRADLADAIAELEERLKDGT